MFPEYIHTWKHNKCVNNDTMRQINKIAPKKVIDFGAGDGFYGKLLKYLSSTCYVTGIEMEPSYVERFGLNAIYDELIVSDLVYVIDTISPNNDYDLAIFGDVIEHLEENIAKDVIEKAVDLFPYIIVNSPIGYQPQEGKVTSEMHRCGIERTMFDNYNVLEWQDYDDEGLMFNCLLRGNI